MTEMGKDRACKLSLRTGPSVADAHWIQAAFRKNGHQLEDVGLFTAFGSLLLLEACQVALVVACGKHRLLEVVFFELACLVHLHLHVRSTDNICDVQ